MTNPIGKMPLRSVEIIKLKDAFQGKGRGKFIDTRIFGNGKEIVEKNWVFFNNGTNLLALYSIKPFVLGELAENTMVARIKREYNCINRFSTAHLSSNALRINNKGQHEYIFIFNEKHEDWHLTYDAYIGFMEVDTPHRLLRITKDKLDLGVPSDSFIYIDSITVKGKTNLFAERYDTLIVSGGVDDSAPFYKEFPVDFFLNLNTVECHAENNEMDFFLDSITSRCDASNTITIISGIVAIICLIKLLNLDRYFHKR